MSNSNCLLYACYFPIGAFADCLVIADTMGYRFYIINFHPHFSVLPWFSRCMLALHRSFRKPVNPGSVVPFRQTGSTVCSSNTLLSLLVPKFLIGFTFRFECVLLQVRVPQGPNCLKQLSIYRIELKLEQLKFVLAIFDNPNRIKL